MMPIARDDRWMTGADARTDPTRPRRSVVAPAAPTAQSKPTAGRPSTEVDG